MSSSRPSSPRKTSAVRLRAASSAAISGATDVFATPRLVAIGCAGLASGPKKLKVVGTPSCLRIGATCRIAGWKTGAKKKVMPTSAKICATRSGERSRRIPSTSSISEEPVLPEADLLPCFMTGTPAAEARMLAIDEILTVPTMSPPVPTMSTASLPVSRITERSNMTSTKPASSSTLSPFERRPIMNAPTCASAASPDMICSIAHAAAGRSRSFLASSRPKIVGQVRVSLMPKV